MSQEGLESFGVGVFHEPMQFERCCGWSPTQPRSVEEQLHGSSVCAKRNVTLYEPSKEHAAPTELGEGLRGVGVYRHGAPTELFNAVHGRLEVVHGFGAWAKQEAPHD